MSKVIGVISDTHGLIRDEVKQEFQNVDAIFHAGDIGSLDVVQALKTIAPLTIIRGNIDKNEWANNFPAKEIVNIEGRCIYIIHNIADLELDPTENFSIVVYGHSLVPKNEMKDRVLYFNPGSAGPRRFKLPISVGKLHFNKGNFSSELITIG